MKQTRNEDGAILTGVIRIFRSLAARPHGSRREQAESDFLKSWLKWLGAEVEQDELGNLKGDLPATPGQENAPLLCLQGHMDMVCAAGPDSSYCPETDPITVEIHDGWLCSDGRSSLGADNNLGNAAVLYLLERGISHGPLRILFTVQEEIGLQGALALPDHWLEGVRYVINTDGFQSDHLTVSSASGLRETWRRPLTWAPCTARQGWRIKLEGFLGGHSGFDIAKGRGNPIRILGDWLNGLEGIQLAGFTGGHAHNAIPIAAQAEVYADDATGMEEALSRLACQVERYRESDAGCALHWEPIGEPPAQVWGEETRQGVLAMVCGLFTGVDAMNPDFPEIPLCSSNLGAVRTEGNEVELYTFIRSADQVREDAVRRQHDELAASKGFSKTFTYYPGWPMERDNPLVDIFSRAYEEETGGKLILNAAHVGLEPSALLGKNPDLSLVCYGPDIVDAHSVDERADLHTLPAFVRVLERAILAVSQGNAGG